MHCPQCGQQQVSEVTRFCSRCGFPLEGVSHLLARGGMLPVLPAEPVIGTGEISPRRKGVKQGALIFLLGVLIVPAMGVLYGFSDFALFSFLAALAAVVLFIGGPLRMLYAALFEQGAPRPLYPSTVVNYAPSALQPPPRVNALPPAPANPAGGWRRPNTAELADRPSVTENTTRLLNHERERGSDQ